LLSQTPSKLFFTGGKIIPLKTPCVMCIHCIMIITDDVKSQFYILKSPVLTICWVVCYFLITLFNSLAPPIPQLIACSYGCCKNISLLKLVQRHDSREDLSCTKVITFCESRPEFSQTTVCSLQIGRNCCSNIPKTFK